MILHATEYKRLKSLQATGKAHHLTIQEELALHETENAIKKSPSMRQEYLGEQPTQIKHIANKHDENVTPDALTKQYHDDNRKRVEQANKETIVNAPGLYQNDGVYLKSKVLSDATSIPNGTLRSLASRGLVEKNANSEISVKSLTDYVSQEVNKKWAEYQKMKTAQDLLNQ